MLRRLTLGPDAVDEAEEFIYTFVVWGEHMYDRTRQWTIDDMRREIPDYHQVLQDVRSGYPVKYFENLLSTTWQVSSPVPGTGVRNSATGETSTLAGSGVIELSTYVSRISTAVEAWRRAVDRASPGDLLTAVGDGIASLEAYVNQKAQAWNVEHPSDQLVDSRKKPVPLRHKLEKWVPHMTEGRAIERDSPFWSDFIEIKRYRDEEAMHPRMSVGAIDLVEFVRLLNLFTSGIAIPLFNLHTLFMQQTPSVVIRAAYAPKVRIATTATDEAASRNADAG